MAVNWTDLKTASASMVEKAKEVVEGWSEFEQTVKQSASSAAESDKAAWTNVQQTLQTFLNEAKKAQTAAKALDSIADSKKEDQRADAEMQLTNAETAADSADKIFKDIKAKLKPIDEDEDVLDPLDTFNRALQEVKSLAATDAKRALGETPAADTVETKPVTETPPAATQPGATQPGATQPGAVAKTSAEKALAAAEEGSKQAEAADTAAKNIEKAADLTAAKATAKTVAGAAKTAKEKAGEAQTEAGKAKGEVKTEAAIKAWGDAADAAGEAKKAAETAETEANKVEQAKTLEEAKTTAKAVVTAASTAKDKAAAAKNKVSQAKSPGTVPGAAAPGAPKPPEKTASAFGMSVTAAYSRKFSLETKMHSEIKVTMVPYPPPALFVDWIRDHFEEEKKKRE